MEKHQGKQAYRVAEHGREYNTRIVSVFGDISGFGEWIDSLSDQEVELKPFMRNFDQLIDEFEDQSEYFVKRFGDGFLIILELKQGDNGREIAFLLSRLINLELNMRTIIEKQSFPRPTGFRVRVTSGFAWKKVHRGHVDYIAKSINLSAKLLRIGKNIPFMIHESVKDFMPPRIIKKNIFRFEKVVIANGNGLPSGVYQKDMDSLWGLRTISRKVDKKILSIFGKPKLL